MTSCDRFLPESSRSLELQVRYPRERGLKRWSNWQVEKVVAQMDFGVSTVGGPFFLSVYPYVPLQTQHDSDSAHWGVRTWRNSESRWNIQVTVIKHWVVLTSTEWNSEKTEWNLRAGEMIKTITINIVGCEQGLLIIYICNGNYFTIICVCKERVIFENMWISK